MDVVDAPTRSRMMAGIGSRDTRPELVLRRALHAMGFRYRLHVKGLVGRPDIVLPKWRAAVFVHGCYWHRHEGCRFTTTPSTRPDFWRAKFVANVERDRRTVQALMALGWRVAIIWECALRKPGDAGITAEALATWLTGSDGCLEWGSDDIPAGSVSVSQ